MNKPAVRRFVVSFNSPKTSSEELKIHFLLNGMVAKDVTYQAVQQYIEVHAEDIAGGLEFRKVRGPLAISASHEFVRRNKGIVERLRRIVQGLFALH